MNTPGVGMNGGAGRDPGDRVGPPRRRSRFRSNIPLPLDHFFGHDQEIVEIKDVLHRARLLTFTGPGGVGKTRLAVQIGSELREQYRDDVWLVDLSHLGDPELIPQAIAHVLGLQDEPGRPVIDALRDFLQSRQLLLILDTCEHLIEGCAALITSLVRVAPNLQLLATSREPLRIPEEHRWPVAPLPVPDPQFPEVDHLLRADAVHLFIDRARANDPDFTITRQNAPTVAQICRRLDGLPLAIELAAARLRMFPVNALLRRLEDGLALLTSGPRTAPARQQTLRATIDWSYTLLRPVERLVFNRLSVFAGGWTLEMAEAVIAGEGVEAGAVRDLVGALVDKSLVMVEIAPDASRRYRLLEPLRQYGRQRLAASQEEAAVRHRHAGALLALAEAAEQPLRGPEPAAWLARLEREHANLHAAWEWTLETGQIETEVRLAGALWPFWYLSGHLDHGQHGVEWAIAVLRTSGSVIPASIQANALTAAAAIGAIRSEYPAAMALSAESLSRFRRIGDRVGVATTLSLRGAVARQQGDLDLARECGEESLALFRALSDRWGSAVCLAFLAAVAEQQGDAQRAEALLTEGVALRRELGQSWGIAQTLFQLGSVVLRQGDHARANELLLNGLALRRELGDQPGAAPPLEKLAGGAMVREVAEQAVRFGGIVVGLCAALGVQAPRCAAYEQMLTAARAELGDEGFRATWAAGRSLAMEQMADTALVDGEPCPPALVITDLGCQGRSCSLTPREREVAVLVAQGLTNGEIARTLALSKRTIDAHIANILGKLQFANRAQIAVWITAMPS